MAANGLEVAKLRAELAAAEAARDRQLATAGDGNQGTGAIFI